jgi:hypothetical protein
MTTTTDTPTAAALLHRAKQFEAQAALNDAYRRATGVPVSLTTGYAATRRKMAAELRARAAGIMAAETIKEA